CIAAGRQRIDRLTKVEVGGVGGIELGRDLLALVSKSGGADLVTDFALGLDHLRFDDGVSVKSAAIADLDHLGSLDLTLQLSSGSVGLLGLASVTDWHTLL